jgi:hypothetical protein
MRRPPTAQASERRLTQCPAEGAIECDSRLDNHRVADREALRTVESEQAPPQKHKARQESRERDQGTSEAREGESG